MIAKLNKENPELAQYTLHIWRQDGVNTVRPSVPADAAGAKAMAPMALRKGRELVEGTIERTNLYDSIKDEVKIWRKYRKINDRSTHSLKKAFFNIIKNPDFENPFDFYGSLYWVKRSKNLIFVLVQRYPEEIRGPLIEVQNSISDYQQLKSMHNPIFLSYIFTFILVTLIILFLSIWCAFYFARGLVQPIHELISAMSKIRSGNLNSRITNHPSNDLRHLTIGLNDMTSALQQAQQKLDAQNQEMLKINTLKTWQEAAKQMAHEIKNPLTPIQLATQRMQRKYSQVLGNDPIFESSTNTILTQVKIIQDLVSHFYKFATLPQLNTQPTQINDLIKDSVSLYQISYPEIIFELSLDNSNTVLNLDQNKIKRVFTNLLDNSIRAMQKLADGRQKVVAISTKMADNKLEIIFSDTGPGIPKTMKTKLFLPYVSTEKKNMGLGLAIVHEIILQHGGTIQLESSECGAKFKIELPAN
jgi:nitrogen fixation/metabolism regulation signal transduction histidine kinase